MNGFEKSDNGNLEQVVSFRSRQIVGTRKLFGERPVSADKFGFGRAVAVSRGKSQFLVRGRGIRGCKTAFRRDVVEIVRDVFFVFAVTHQCLCLAAS